MIQTVFSDQTKDYINPVQCKKGDIVHIRLRVGKDMADKTYLVADDKIFPMQKEFSLNGFDYYSTDIEADADKISYHFRIEAQSRIWFYGRKGVVSDEKDVAAFELLPGFIIPQWLCGALIYQIFPDRFYNGDKGNDVLPGEYEYLGRQIVKVENWLELPKAFDVANFYGGDLPGVEKKLDYLAWLGVEVIYLNPVFLSPSNHKYDVMDFDHIDPHLANVISKGEKYSMKELDEANDYFVQFVKKCHEKGIRVILDGVFNHCSHFHRWMDREHKNTEKSAFQRGAYANPKSRYHDYFRFEDGECKIYESWWNNENLPKLNYEGSNELCADIMRISKKWITPPYNVDGWRLDVAADLGHSEEFNHRFWKYFRKVVKQSNPEAVIIAEHYDDTRQWLDGKQWDTIMNYRAFMEPVSLFFTGMEKHSDWFDPTYIGDAERFEQTMRENCTEMPCSSMYASMNQLDNHDHSRFITRTNHKVGRLEQLGSRAADEDICPCVMRQAVMMQMTWPGSPCIYYGDEIGLCGFTDPDSRRTYPWGYGDFEMLDFYKSIIEIRKEHKMLKDSSVKIIYSKPGILAYGRFNLEEQIIVAFSTSDTTQTVKLPVWLCGISKSEERVRVTRVLESDTNGYEEYKKRFWVKNGYLRAELKPHSGIIWLSTNKNEY